MIELHPHQQKSVDGVREHLMRGSTSVLLQAATGAGKSVMASYMVKQAGGNGKTTMFVVPRNQLLRQMANTYRGFGIEYGIIDSQYNYSPHKNHHICSLVSLHNKMKRIPMPDIMVIDECHYGAGHMDALIQHASKHNTIIIGLSATPRKENGESMGKWYTSMVKGESIRWLIDNNYLSDYRLFQGVKTDVSSARMRADTGDYIVKDLEEILWSDKGRVKNLSSSCKKFAYGKRMIAYGVSIKDCEKIADDMRSDGITAVAISSRDKDHEQYQKIMGFAKGEINVLVNCDLLTFGFDLSSRVNMDVPIEGMIDAAPTQSLVKQLQKNGRALRMKPDAAIIIDAAGNLSPSSHGLPCDDRDWSLISDITKRGKTNKERSIAVRQCERCFFCFPPAPTCPFCGHVHPIKEREVDEIDGEMAEVDKEMIAQASKEKRMEVGQARSMADLRHIQRERGYKPSWVFIQAKIKGIKG